MPLVVREALDMLANKLSRALNGNPEYVDTWLDIAGYAQLVVDHIKGQQAYEDTPR